MKKRQALVDPTGVDSYFEYWKRLGEMRYGPIKESAEDFNIRFDELVEKLRKATQHGSLSDIEEKRAYLLAIECAVPELFKQEKLKKRAGPQWNSSNSSQGKVDIRTK